MVNIVDISSIVKLKSKEGLLTVEEIAEKETSKWHPTHFFGWALFNYDDYLSHAKQYFKNQVVVDIGCGTDISLYRVCCIAGAKSYIGVDYMYNYDANLRRNLLSETYWEKHNHEFKRACLDNQRDHPRDVPVGLAYEKAQAFLKRLPNNSVSVYAGGIDYCMVPKDEEAREIEKEIVRVLNSKGAFISTCSRLFRSIDGYVPVEGLDKVMSNGESDGEFYDMVIMTKKKKPNKSV